MTTQSDTSQEFKIKSDLLLKPLKSAEELRHWFNTFLDIYFPMGVVDAESTHGPIEAAWRIYELIQTGDAQHVPQVTMLASRDSYKTLIASALEVLLMLHFRISVAHMAAISSQSMKAIQYINSFFRKLRPYLEMNGWGKQSDNKSIIEWITEEGELTYIKIVIATIAGANSEHVPLLFVDEVDVIQDPRALKEAKMIPSMYKGRFPLTVYLSTRKFAGGLMEKTLKETVAAGGEVLRWNIIDVCERISHEEAKIDEPKVKRYLSHECPMINLSEEEWKQLSSKEQQNYDELMAYAGIAEHPLLPVMHNRLVDRPQEDHGNLYKPVIAVLNNFRQLPPDMAEAQLRCHKPSKSGLVYPKFSEVQNVLTPRQAMTRILGEDPGIDSFPLLVQTIKDLGIATIGGGDWGFTHYTSLHILAPVGNDIFHLDTMCEAKLELDDIVKQCAIFQQEYNPIKWWLEQAYPAYLKTLRRKVPGFVAPEFTKNVEDGITALQGIICNSAGGRRYFIIKQPNNEKVIEAFGEYKWKLDGKGEIVEGKPEHDKDGFADIMDGIRYPAQNEWNVNKKLNFKVAGQKSLTQEKIEKQSLATASEQVNEMLVRDKIKELAVHDDHRPKKKGRRRILW